MSIPGDSECDRLMVEKPRLYIAGHNAKRGVIVQREYQRGDAIRYFAEFDYAKSVVARWNRMAQRRCALEVFGESLESFGGSMDMERAA